MERRDFLLGIVDGPLNEVDLGLELLISPIWV